MDEKDLPDNVAPNPHEKIGGDEGYKGKFRLNYDNRWEQVENEK